MIAKIRQYSCTLLWFAILLITLESGVLSPQAQAEFYTHPWENRWITPQIFRLSPEFTYYTTSSNHGPTGTTFQPSLLENYSRFQTDINLIFGVNSRLSLYGRISWAWARLDTLGLTGTSFGFTDQTAGATIRLFESSPTGITIDFQAQGDFPTYDNSKSAQEGLPYLGDGSVDLTAGGFAGIPLAHHHGSVFKVIGGAGYTYRNQDFSSAVPWSVTLSDLPESGKEGLLASAGVYGIQSLKTDPAGSTARADRVSSGAGGSFFVNTINPSLLTLRGQLGYRFESDYSIQATIAQSMWGQAAPKGFLASIGVNIDLDRSEKSASSKQIRKRYSHSNQGFVDYSFEAGVTHFDPRTNVVQINKGANEGVEMNQIFDVFSARADGSIGEAVARAKVMRVEGSEALLIVVEFFREVTIREGFFAKRPVQ